MKLSRKGAMALLAEEGIVLHAYQCSAGEWTIGAGHTAKAGPPAPKEGMTITLDEALALFRRDIGPFEAGVARAIRIPLAQHQFDALVLFHYNTGAISTGSVDDKLNAGNVAAAIATWRQYVKAGGNTVPGLQARRAREIGMFEHGEYFERAILLEEADGRRRNVMPSSLPWPGDPPPPPDIPKPEPPPAPVPQPAPQPAAPSGLIGLLLALLKLIFGRKA